MKRIAAILSDEKGSVLVSTVAVTLTVMFLTFLAYQKIQMTIVAEGVRDAMRSAVTDAVTQNYYTSYDDMLEGSSGAYSAVNGWANNATDGNMENRISGRLGLEEDDSGALVRNVDGQEQYSISNIQIRVQNPPNGSDSSQLSVNATYTLSVELPLGLPPLQIPQSVDASFAQKF